MSVSSKETTVDTKEEPNAEKSLSSLPTEDEQREDKERALHQTGPAPDSDIRSAEEVSKAIPPEQGQGDSHGASGTAEPQGGQDAMPGENGSGEESKDDESEYPNKLKLALITIALCLAVFCMALVCVKAPNPRT
jgi:hypothetical protein